MEMLSEVPDPRDPRGRRHPLSAVLGLTVVALLAGMRGPESIAQYGRDHVWSLLRPLGFRRTRPPCKATFSNIFRALDADRFEAVLRRWLLARCPDLAGQLIIDGKWYIRRGGTVRGSRDGQTPGTHLLAVYAPKASAVVAQLRVDGKTNEHKAALEQLGVLPLSGHVVTADAMFCHRDVCRTIRERGGDYLVFVKWPIRRGGDNQPNLQRDIALALAPDDGYSPLPAARAPGLA